MEILGLSFRHIYEEKARTIMFRMAVRERHNGAISMSEASIL